LLAIKAGFSLRLKNRVSIKNSLADMEAGNPNYAKGFAAIQELHL
jgi:hypothetical protein